MEPKRCEKCGETVESTRAFCPGCGAALVVEEERTDVSAFDASAGTVQFGKTVFGKMLSEMGLNISEAPNKPAAVQPVAVKAQPAAAAPAETLAPEQKQSSRTKWIILGVAVILLAMLAFVGAVLIFLYFRYQQAAV